MPDFLPSQRWIDSLIKQHVETKSALNFVLQTIKQNCAKCPVDASPDNGKCKDCKVDLMAKQITDVL